MRFNAPPNWPRPPVGWKPPAGWKPNPSCRSGEGCHNSWNSLLCDSPCSRVVCVVWRYRDEQTRCERCACSTASTDFNDSKSCAPLRRNELKAEALSVKPKQARAFYRRRATSATATELAMRRGTLRLRTWSVDFLNDGWLTCGFVELSAPYPAHRAHHAVVIEGKDESSAAVLRSTSLCRMQPATSPRRATALLRAVVASRNFIRESML